MPSRESRGCSELATRSASSTSLDWLHLCQRSLIYFPQPGVPDSTVVKMMAALCVMYMLLFGVILLGFRNTPQPPGLAIRLGALAAFFVALVSFVLPIVARVAGN